MIRVLLTVAAVALCAGVAMALSPAAAPEVGPPSEKPAAAVAERADPPIADDGAIEEAHADGGYWYWLKRQGSAP